MISEVTGEYVFEPKGPSPYYHWRAVKWISPRSFWQDLLNACGAFMTICRVKKNNAEARVAAMTANESKSETLKGILYAKGSSGSRTCRSDLSLVA